ncbi:ATP-binding protein [Actinomadura scrupuli]|uniref:ATP-binding protein n=1 Tax=Actinomadura scrupuli TaxID=559629 RepID=UPI003D972A86
MDDTKTARHPDPGHPAYTLACKAVPEAAAAVRLLIREALAEWHMAELVDGAGLVATELVSNAIRSGDDIAVEIRPVTAGAARHLRIEVFDTSPQAPRRQGGDLLDEHGKGLQLVAAFAADWGHRPVDGGKVVWALLGPAAGQRRATKVFPPRT